jgi:hypothetical protein
LADDEEKVGGDIAVYRKPPLEITASDRVKGVKIVISPEAW